MEEPNPYAPPTAKLDGGRLAEGKEEHYGYATTGQRFANLVLDYIGITITSVVLLVPAMLLWGEGVLEEGLDQLFGLGGLVLYYVVAEGFTGRTLGKFVTGTKVIAAGGGTPGFGKILGRTLVRLVPFEPFSHLGSGPTGWHDRWSGTCVVRTRPNAQDTQRRARQAKRAARLAQRTQHSEAS